MSVYASGGAARLAPTAEETVYVVPGSDAESFVPRRFPHKKVRLIGNGLRADSAKSFLESLPIIFQREQSEGLNAAYHFTFTGDENLTGTVVIKDRQIEVLPGHGGKADLSLTADSKSWLDFLAKEKGLLPALLRRKIRIKGQDLAHSFIFTCQKIMNSFQIVTGTVTKNNRIGSQGKPFLYGIDIIFFSFFGITAFSINYTFRIYCRG
jgi:putative sterol carrier protein